MSAPTVVGGASVEIIADLAKFGEAARTQIGAALDNPELKETVTAGLDKAAEGATASGRQAATDLAAGIRAGGPEVTAAAETTATEAGAASKEKMAESGAESGAAFKDGMLDNLKGLATAAVPLLGVLAGGELVKSSIEAADQLEESNIKIENVFGSSADAVKQWSSNVAGSLRESAVTAETQLGTWGVALGGLGVGKAQAAGLSEQLTTLTANMAAYNKVDQGTVQSALEGALKGRTTALRQFGVTLTATQINQEALTHAAELGTIQMKDGQPVLNTQQKALATLYGVMDATKNQQGGLASTSDTLKAKQQVLSAEFDNFRAKLGGYLLPILGSVAGFIVNTFIPGLSKLWDWAGPKLTPVVQGLGAVIKDVFGVAKTIVTDFVGGFTGNESVVDGVSGWRESIYTLGVDIQQTFTKIKPYVEELGADLLKLADWIKTNVLPVVVELWAWWEEHVLHALEDVVVFIGNDLLPVLAAIAKWITDNKPTVLTFVAVIGLAVAAFLAWKIALEAVRIATELATAAQALFDGAMDANPVILIVIAIAALAAGIVYAYTHSKDFRDIVNAIGDALKKVWNDVLKPVADFFMNHWKVALQIAFFALAPFIAIPLLIIQKWGTIATFFKNLWSDITGYFTTAVNWLKQAGINIIDGLWTGIQFAWQIAYDWFIGWPLMVIGYFVTALTWLTNAGENVITGLWNGLHTIWNREVAFFENIGSTIGGYFTGAITWLEQVGKDIIQGLFNGFADAAGDAGTGFATVATDIKNGLNTVLHLPWKIPKISLGFGVNVGGETLIPRLAAGGMTTGPGSFVMGDNPSGQEVALPLDSPATIAALSIAMSKAMDNGPANKLGPGSTTALDPNSMAAIMALANRPVIVTVDKREIARAANNGQLSLNRGGPS